MTMETCPESGKLIYFARGKAEASLRSLVERRPEYTGRVYPCNACGGYHIGREKKGTHKNKYR